MTKLLSLSGRPREYSSIVRFASGTMAGVYVTIRRMSLARRIELAREVRGLAGRLEYHAGGMNLTEKIDASITAAEIDSVYLRWGVVRIEGLCLDGCAASCEDVISAAPEAFVREIVERIKHECGLTGEETKN